MGTWQAMDSSHVSLVSLHMKADGFEHFRCDRNLSLGMNLASLTKVLKCSGNDDVVTLKADDAADTITVMFESKSTFLCCALPCSTPHRRLAAPPPRPQPAFNPLALARTHAQSLVPSSPASKVVHVSSKLLCADEDRISDFEIKLMDIDSEHLGIPDTDYNATVKMPSAEFQRIVRDLTTLGDTGACLLPVVSAPQETSRCPVCLIPSHLACNALTLVDRSLACMLLRWRCPPFACRCKSHLVLQSRLRPARRVSSFLSPATSAPVM